VFERRRHRYELNNDYRDILARHGMNCTGISPDYRLVEIVEIPKHPYFIATQFHPEFLSRPNRAHPLFRGVIEAAVERSQRLYARAHDHLNGQRALPEMEAVEMALEQ
jgi:CTP synthase